MSLGKYVRLWRKTVPIGKRLEEGCANLEIEVIKILNEIDNSTNYSYLVSNGVTL